MMTEVRRRRIVPFRGVEAPPAPTKPIRTRRKVVDTLPSPVQEFRHQKLIKIQGRGVDTAALLAKIRRRRSFRLGDRLTYKTKDTPYVSGQSGPALTIHYENLNKSERSVLNVLAEDQALRLVDIQRRAFPEINPIRGNSWVRNALRRLVRGGLVERLGAGVYRATQKGVRENTEGTQ